MMVRLTDVRDKTEDVLNDLKQILKSDDPWSHEKLTEIRNDLNECAESVQTIRDNFTK